MVLDGCALTRYEVALLLVGGCEETKQYLRRSVSGDDEMLTWLVVHERDIRNIKSGDVAALRMRYFKRFHEDSSCFSGCWLWDVLFLRLCT